MKETELYAPVRELLVSLGYEVRAEVGHMDAVAWRGDAWIAVELKTSFTLKLLLQATQRQKLMEQVYVALPAPTGRQRFSKAFKEYEHLLRRLELGLILVHFGTAPRAELVFAPGPCPRGPYLARNKRKSAAVRREAEGRRTDHTVGGTNGKLMTVYRENALRAAAFLQERGECSVRELREATGCEAIQPMLRANHYGWFEQIVRGRYRLAPAGADALRTYSDVLERLGLPAATPEGGTGQAPGPAPPAPPPTCRTKASGRSRR